MYNYQQIPNAKKEFLDEYDRIFKHGEYSDKEECGLPTIIIKRNVGSFNTPDFDCILKVVGEEADLDVGSKGK